jgi:hypothetical protein
MDSRNWMRAAIFTGALGAAAFLLSIFGMGRFRWGPAEKPKAQCEALDSTTLAPSLRTALAVAYQSRVAPAIIREPQNTWSNLAFVFVGAVIWMSDRRFFARLLAAALVALGLASGLYHASLIAAWRNVDVATMGWVSCALCCIGFDAARGGKSSAAPSTPRRSASA